MIEQGGNFRATLGGWNRDVGLQPVMDFIRAAKQPDARQVAVPRPVFDPERWNVRGVQINTNCYAYALQAPEWLHVGDLSVCARPRTVNRLFNRIVGDGLVPGPTGHAPDIEGYYQVAAVAGKGWHWYRKDADGFWSHKDGEGPATNLDASGEKITHPLAADRGHYWDYIGNFYVPNEGLKGLVRRNLI